MRARGTRIQLHARHRWISIGSHTQPPTTLSSRSRSKGHETCARLERAGPRRVAGRTLPSAISVTSPYVTGSVGAVITAAVPLARRAARPATPPPCALAARENEDRGARARTPETLAPALACGGRGGMALGARPECRLPLALATLSTALSLLVRCLDTRRTPSPPLPWRCGFSLQHTVEFLFFVF